MGFTSRPRCLPLGTLHWILKCPLPSSGGKNSFSFRGVCKDLSGDTHEGLQTLRASLGKRGAQDESITHHVSSLRHTIGPTHLTPLSPSHSFPRLVLPRTGQGPHLFPRNLRPSVTAWLCKGHHEEGRENQAVSCSSVPRLYLP